MVLFCSPFCSSFFLLFLVPLVLVLVLVLVFVLDLVLALVLVSFSFVEKYAWISLSVFIRLSHRLHKRFSIERSVGHYPGNSLSGLDHSQV